jgi:hypothetical protein
VATYLDRTTLTDQVPTTTTATSAASAAAIASGKPDLSFDQRSQPLAYVTAKSGQLEKTVGVLQNLLPLLAALMPSSGVTPRY